MLKIQEYILKHGLEKTLEVFKLKIREYPTKILLKYNQLVSPTIMALPEVQECRGLILERGSWRVLSMGFKKFFNAEEGNAHKIDWDTAHVLAKIDGSLVSLYFYNGVWCTATTGTALGEGEVNNKLGTTFNQLFWNTVANKYNFNDTLLNKDFIYVFELTTPYNIVVTPHGESSATLLAIRNRITLDEFPYEDVVKMGGELGIPVVKRFDLNAKDVGVLKRTFDNMPWSEEGYVVVDGNFNRIKVKNPAYVAVHSLKGKSAEHNIMTIIVANEIEEFGAVFPERKAEVFRLKENYDNLILQLENIWGELKILKPKNITPAEKKRYAQAVFETCKKYSLSRFTGLFFGLNDGKVSDVKTYLANYDKKVLYKIL